jgi:5'-methylthioadenosine phosphorylase
MAFGRLGIIGGTGLGEELGALGGERVEVATPFGVPAAPIQLTQVEGVPVALLSRHGPGHSYNPSKVPYRANIWALKSLGVTHILASTAVGSLREDIAPRQLAIPDQLIDKTFLRPATFFDDLAVHVEMASPFCPTLRKVLIEAGRAAAVVVHPRATYVCMEGPQFSTRAESDLHRSWGADLIGMTALPEAKLAREAEICYAIVALPTDYDCWRPPPEEVDKQALLSEIIGNLRDATHNALGLIRAAASAVARETAPCGCQSALSLAIWTDKGSIRADVRSRLALLLDKHL